jgi:two-component system nitrogen regulation sensor histidine kinase NtrY
MALTGDSASPPKAKGRTPFRSWFGPIIVIGAVGCALATFLVVAEFGAVADRRPPLPLLIINGVFVPFAHDVIVRLARLRLLWRGGAPSRATVGFFSSLL